MVPGYPSWVTHTDSVVGASTPDMFTPDTSTPDMATPPPDCVKEKSFSMPLEDSSSS